MFTARVVPLQFEVRGVKACPPSGCKVWPDLLEKPQGGLAIYPSDLISVDINVAHPLWIAMTLLIPYNNG